MFRYAVPTILIVIAVTGFFLFISPTYKNITDLKAQAASYDQALNNSKSLEAERDKLTLKYNSIDSENLVKLQKLLPDNVDNIRLILEIGNIASPYGMVLKDVKYDTLSQEETTKTTNSLTEQQNKNSSKMISKNNKEHGIWNLEFTTQGTYDNFLNFVKDLEKNLRIVDISTVQFSSALGTGTGANMNIGITPAAPNIYKYSFNIKTYWLKN